MTTTPSPAAEMLELAAKATAGPWHSCQWSRSYASRIIADNPGREDAHGDIANVMHMPRRQADEVLANAAFIARSRTLGPLLAQQVVELTAERDALTTVYPWVYPWGLGRSPKYDQPIIGVVTNAANGKQMRFFGCLRPTDGKDAYFDDFGEQICWAEEIDKWMPVPAALAGKPQTQGETG